MTLERTALGLKLPKVLFDAVGAYLLVRVSAANSLSAALLGRAQIGKAASKVVK